MPYGTFTMENFFFGNICRGLPVREAGVFMRLFAPISLWELALTESFARGISFDGAALTESMLCEFPVAGEPIM